MLHVGFTIAASMVFIVLVSVLVKLTRHFTSLQHLPVTANWIDELSIDRYRPMLRLLNQEDVQFLRTQPGYTPQMATKFRLQRCQLFLKYLLDLDNDFRRICMALKILMVQSKHDRPDLASVLVRSQITFAWGMMMVQFQLACYRHGLGSVDVSDLVKVFDGMRLELRILLPAESWGGA